MDFAQDVTLDLNANIPYTTIVAKQGDSARWLRVFLTKDNIAYPLDASHNFMFRMRKADGKGIINPAIVTEVTTSEYTPITVTYENYLRQDLYIKNNDEYIKCEVDDFFENAGEIKDQEEFDEQARYVNNSGYYIQASNFNQGTVYYNWRTDQQYYQNLAFISYEQSFVGVQLTNQVLAVAGRGYADIVEYDEKGGILSSVSFIINVMASPNVAGAAVSDNQFQILADAISQATDIAETAKNAAKTYMQNKMPKIENSNWQLYNGTEWVDSGERAVGIDGADGKTTLIVKVNQVDENQDVSLKQTSVVLEGKKYYSDTEYKHEAGTTNSICAVDLSQGIPIIEINNITYYVQQKDVTDSTDSIIYYILDVPQGRQGTRGPAGAGGVTWVDGENATSEYHFEGDTYTALSDSEHSRNFSAVAGQPGTYLFDKSDNDVDDKICGYKQVKIENGNLNYNVIISIPENSSGFTSYFKIVFKDKIVLEGKKYYSDIEYEHEVGTTNSTYIVNIEGNINTIKIDDNIFYVKTEDISLPVLSKDSIVAAREYTNSGNVRLEAVSYKPQESFITYNENGVPTTVKITDSMRAVARANIKAMGEITPTDSQQILFSNDGISWQVYKLSPLSDEDISYIINSNTTGQENNTSNGENSIEQEGEGE